MKKQKWIEIRRYMPVYCEKCWDELIYDMDHHPKCYGCTGEEKPFTVKCIPMAFCPSSEWSYRVALKNYREKYGDDSTDTETIAT